jgi:OmpA-OmpF porin, OOP family
MPAFIKESFGNDILRTVMMPKALALLFLVLPLLGQTPAKDVKGSSDHPLVGRFEGSVITYFNTKDFDEAVFFNALPPAPANTIKAEGKLTQIHYDAPAGRSSLEIFRNFQQRMSTAGFQTISSCEKEKCTPHNPLIRAAFDSNALNRAGFSVGFGENPRFACLRLKNSEKDVLVSLFVGETRMANTGPLVLLRTLDSKPMETGKIIVPSAQEMTQSFARDGRVALYGIFFDTGLAVLKPESKPTLDQIAELLKANPKLNLVVVGHTDNIGDFQANVLLSQRRAATVADALNKQYAIPATRLQPAGAGMIAPAASNADEAGRARNRRVELVPR